MELTRIDRKYAYLNLTATDAEGNPVVVSDVSVALLPLQSRPDAATTWTAVTQTAGRYRVLLAGPDASGVGALVVPATANLWARVTDTPEVDAEKLDRITIN